MKQIIIWLIISALAQILAIGIALYFYSQTCNKIESFSIGLIGCSIAGICTATLRLLMKE